MIEKTRQQQYGRRYKLPAIAIEALQELKILPVSLPWISDVRPEDHAFLQRYSLLFMSHRFIRSSLSRCTPEDRALYLQPAQDWTQYVILEYMKAYRAKSDTVESTSTKLPTQNIYQALSEKFGLQLTTMVRKKVDALRRAAFRRVVRENQKGG